RWPVSASRGASSWGAGRANVDVDAPEIFHTEAPCRRTTSFVSSADRFLHERGDPGLVGGGQLLQREGRRPHGAVVEVRLVAEAERRVPRVELVRALEEAEDLVVLGICGHPVPGLRREAWRAGLDERVDPLGQGAILSRHLGDLGEQGAFPVRFARFRLELLGALLHRGALLGRERLAFLGGLGGPLRALLCRFPLSHTEAPPSSSFSFCPLFASLYRTCPKQAIRCGSCACSSPAARFATPAA